MSSEKDTRIIEVDATLPTKLDSVPGRGEYSEKARQERLSFLEEQTGTDPKWISQSKLSSEFVQGNIENYIGSIEIPVGLAGPLMITGAAKMYVSYLPLATTEGALVASVSRGARLITESGGCRAQIISQRMVRAPVFKFRSIAEAVSFTQFIDEHLGDLQDIVESASQFAFLTSIETEVIGRIVHTRFVYETADAAGQNMTTKCTARCCEWLVPAVEQFLGIRPTHSQLEGNTSGDKKVSTGSYHRGRGARVSAECEISNDKLSRIMNVSADKFFEAYQIGLSGGIASGMIGYNINVANVVAALFTATGQDIACVHESSLGHFHVERTEHGLYASMTLPNLIVGTIGGGTALPGQREMLESLGCLGENGVNTLVEIICATCLALDLSTLAAIAAGEFADAHERLARRSIATQQ